MKTVFEIFLFACCFFVFSVGETFACGDNSPEKLEARAREHFERWDVNKNKFLELEEFVAGDGYSLGPDADERSWVQLFKDKLPLVDAFGKADTDHSGGLSYEEWISIRPFSMHMLRKGC